MSKITESDIELFIIEELERLGYQFLYGPDISCDGLFSERQSYRDIILANRLRAAIRKLNPNIPPDAQEQAHRAVQRINSPDLLANNEAFHRYLVEKVKANASIDWTIRESAKAKLMVLVKRTLTKYGYPPDMQQKAVDTVLKQAELLANYFVSGEL